MRETRDRIRDKDKFEVFGKIWSNKLMETSIEARDKNNLKYLGNFGQRSEKNELILEFRYNFGTVSKLRY